MECGWVASGRDARGPGEAERSVTRMFSAYCFLPAAFSSFSAANSFS